MLLRICGIAEWFQELSAMQTHSEPCWRSAYNAPVARWPSRALIIFLSLISFVSLHESNWSILISDNASRHLIILTCSIHTLQLIRWGRWLCSRAYIMIPNWQRHISLLSPGSPIIETQGTCRSGVVWSTSFILLLLPSKISLWIHI
jgi:hypothetical protein